MNRRSNTKVMSGKIGKAKAVKGKAKTLMHVQSGIRRGAIHEQNMRHKLIQDHGFRARKRKGKSAPSAEWHRSEIIPEEEEEEKATPKKSEKNVGTMEYFEEAVGVSGFVNLTSTASNINIIFNINIINFINCINFINFIDFIDFINIIYTSINASINVYQGHSFAQCISKQVGLLNTSRNIHFLYYFIQNFKKPPVLY